MADSIKVKATGSVSNVACGFDCLGYSMENPGDEITLTKKSTEEINITMSGIQAEKISVNLEKKNSTILISIDDDGPGVKKSEFQNITKPFYKIDKSRSESKSSVGLGLSISSDIIKSHGGDINFNKSKLGGLKVTISLPY